MKYVSICSPNYLHDAHVRLALRSGATAICEKPLVINPWNLDQLALLEEEYALSVKTVLQLRYLPDLLALKKRLQESPPKEKADVLLTYTTRRGRWYHVSWKGREDKSGGLAMNIGIHLFDMMIWLFGAVSNVDVQCREPDRATGTMDLEHAHVRWYLSTREEDVPAELREKGQHAFRSIQINGEEIEFSTGFKDLHTTVYREILAGRGYGIEDARPSIELAYRVRTQGITQKRESVHPSYYP